MVHSLILFDDTCPLCWHSVSVIQKWDKKGLFQFSPLNGNAAKKALKEKWVRLKNAGTVVLIEDSSSQEPRIWIKGRAVMRICWLIGGWRKLFGWLAFMPFGVDAVYSFIAKRRHQFFKK